MTNPVNIHKDVVTREDGIRQGTTNLTTANTTINAIPTQLAPIKGVQLRAGIANAGTVYIGGADVDFATANALCGLPLEAGDVIFLPVGDTDQIKAVNSDANDILHWLVM